jgi:methionyl-tRNA synthetase
MISHIKRNILITNAIPYANGDLHLGHLVGYLHSDFWKSFHILQGHTCFHICGSDVHGTPIMLHARALNKTEHEIWSTYKENHIRVLKGFYINFDVWGDTHDVHHQDVVHHIYKQLKSKGFIYTKTVLQFYDVQEQMFLSDRLIKGVCPFCKSKDQYADACELCGKSYEPKDLINPRSMLSGHLPVMKESDHIFFKLSEFRDTFNDMNTYLSEESLRAMSSWKNVELKDWCISRDTPYYGISVPDVPNKYFYVWFDAILSYISFLPSSDLWNLESSAEIYQFIGKDIQYFHSLFWAAILRATDRRLPTQIIVNGFLSVNSKKISKSRDITMSTGAAEFLESFDPEVYRFFIARRSTGSMDDINLDIEEMKHLYNHIVIGKIVNIASRSSTFFQKYFNYELDRDYLHNYDREDLLSQHIAITHAYQNRQFHKVIEKVEELADYTNKQFSDLEPWHMINSDPKSVHRLCTMSLQNFYIITRWLQPILPRLYEQARSYVKDTNDAACWNSCISPLNSSTISHFTSMAQRV